MDVAPTSDADVPYSRETVVVPPFGFTPAEIVAPETDSDVAVPAPIVGASADTAMVREPDPAE
jgi:hypothetical protein